MGARKFQEVIQDRVFSCDEELLFYNIILISAFSSIDMWKYKAWFFWSDQYEIW